MPPRWRSLSAPTRPRRWPRERAAAADRGAAPRGPEADQDGGRGPPNGRDPSEPRGSEALRGGREGPGRGAEGDRRDPADAAAGSQEAVGPIQNALDQVQMLYVRETSGQPPSAEQPPKDEPPPQSKIWTPG